MSGFANDFLWGAATAAAQVEGGWNCGGRSPSIWDMAPAAKIKNGENCRHSCDHFHRWKEDVALMKEIGLKSYRFSISWSRVMPAEGHVNQAGLKFYSDLVDELLKNGIEPIVTIFHWDMPLWVYRKGGWLSDSIIPLFRDYTRTVVDALSDRVQWWIPMNEPQCFIMNGYMQGIHAPFKRDYLALSKLTRICMLAFAESVQEIRTHAKKTPKIGIAMAAGAFVPASNSVTDVEKARMQTTETGLGLMSNRWWMDPILAGKPVSAYGVYHTSTKDLAKIHQKLDFLGLNLYQPFNHAAWGGDGSKPAPGAPKTSMGWDIDGRVMYWAVKFIYDRYKLPIMITENGMANTDVVSLDGSVHDPQRSDFMMRYLRELKRAVEEGYPVIGYQHWSLLDNFEWAEGYDPRFGLIYVDYSTGKRTVKDSARMYRHIIETNGAEL